MYEAANTNLYTIERINGETCEHELTASMETNK